MELVSLAEPFQHLLGAVHVSGARVLVVVAEQPEERRADVFRQVDRGDRALRREVRGIIDDDTAAPAIHHRVDLRNPAGGEVGIAAARAESDHADLAVRLGLAAQIGHRPGDVADHLVVRIAALSAHACRLVVGASGTDAEIEVGGDGADPVMGELARHLDAPFVPAGHVMDDDDARIGTVAERT